MENWKRNAGLFIGGQFASMFGSMLVQYAITWHITLATQSGVWMALFGPLGDLVRIEALLIATGFLMMASAFALAKSKTLKAAGE